MPDLVDDILGLAPAAELRRQRPDFVRHTQGSHDVLLTPDDPGGVSLYERAAIALRVASMERDEALMAHYRARLDSLGGQPSSRLPQILDHVATVVATPREATRANLDALRALGLSPRDIVVITQIVAFVSYQVRVVAGLRALSS